MWNTQKSFQHLKGFIKNLLGSLCFSIKKEIVLSKEDRRSTHVEEVNVFGTEAIYARIMCLISLKQIDLETALNYELAPIPTALFKDNSRNAVSRKR